MNKVELQEFAGGALQEKFNKSFEKVVENLKDVNTSFKVKRRITIQVDFVQNEMRDDVRCDISVVEKLAPQAPMTTQFAIEKNLESGEIIAREYGRGMKGQMSLDDFKQDEEPQGTVSYSGKEVDAETGEIKSDTIVDFRKAAAQ